MGSKATPAPDVGSIHEIAWPFVRDVWGDYDEDGPTRFLTWKPGFVSEQASEYDAVNSAHGSGIAKFTVVDVHRLPHPYPARVFYTRSWTDPDGKTFGKKKLLITTIPAFRRLTSQDGFARLHVEECEDLSENGKANMLREG